MSVHPVLEEMERNGTWSILEGGQMALCDIGVDKHHTKRQVYAWGNETSMHMALAYHVRLPYDISKSARTRLYLKKLHERLLGNDIEIGIDGTSTVRLVVRYHPCDFPPRPTQQDAASFLSNESMKIYVIGEGIVAAARVCYRLDQSGGTPRYRKLLPHHLVDLTVCGLGVDSLPN